MILIEIKVAPRNSTNFRSAVGTVQAPGCNQTLNGAPGPDNLLQLISFKQLLLNKGQRFLFILFDRS